MVHEALLEFVQAWVELDNFLWSMKMAQGLCFLGSCYQHCMMFLPGCLCSPPTRTTANEKSFKFCPFYVQITSQWLLWRVVAVGKVLLKGSCCCRLWIPAGKCAGLGALGVNADWVGGPSWDSTGWNILDKMEH